MDSLFSEILSNVFSFLHIEDKKSVRLVCRKWNADCNCPAITRKEKFVFRAGYPIDAVNTFLHNCVRFRSTVEFQGLPVSKLPRHTWRLIGEKILSLSLIECDVSSTTTRNIFLFCLNMHTFRLTYQFRQNSSNINRVFCSSEILDLLVQQNVVRPKLTTFQLLVNGMEIEKSILQKVFKIFPCIRNFGTGYTSYTDFIFAMNVYGGSLCDIFDPARIKELTFNVPCSGLWLQEFASIKELKLQKLETILRCPVVPRPVLKEFFGNQTELRTIKMVLMGADEDYGRMALFEILSSCSNLIDFRFKCDDGLMMAQFLQLLRTVSRSNFECLMLKLKYIKWSEDDFFDDDLSSALTPLGNSSLRILKLDAPVLEESCVAILKHFCNLQHLELASASDKILQTIWQYLVRLQTLVLRRTDHCTAFGFTGRDPCRVSGGGITHSISRLHELKHLELEGFLSHLWIERAVFEFNFPRLKYLRLSLWGLAEEVSNRIFTHLPMVVPSVEVLVLDEIAALRGHHYAYFCRHLKRLKLLLCNWLGDDPNAIKELFMLRQSLKYAVDLSDTAYFYDRSTGNLRIFHFKDLEFKKSVFCDRTRS